jgi:hypothetical protein
MEWVAGFSGLRRKSVVLEIQTANFESTWEKEYYHLILLAFKIYIRSDRKKPEPHQWKD